VTTYLIVGECLALASLLSAPRGSRMDLTMVLAGIIVIVSVLLWPILVVSTLWRMK
jgi:hypothetical protein